MVVVRKVVFIVVKYLKIFLCGGSSMFVMQMNEIDTHHLHIKERFSKTMKERGRKEGITFLLTRLSLAITTQY